MEGEEASRGRGEAGRSGLGEEAPQVCCLEDATGGCHVCRGDSGCGPKAQEADFGGGWGKGWERKSIFLGEVGVSRKLQLWSCMAPKDMLIPKPLVLMT